ncbi:hypothetical protein [Aeromonas dhakensis]|uniref:hypothetical protein n=1 Tax=Aeromonas dhakensis TaxID=196024 RepID=UPI0023662007|nr:hypothetical protein [Aeromonas dhakensis]WDF96095.1 hypothetical protein PUB92_07060 [Aeromonas dhakensis]
MLTIIKSDVISKHINSNNHYLLDKLKLFASENRHHIIFENNDELDAWLSKDLNSGHFYKESIKQNNRAAILLPNTQKKIIVTADDISTWGSFEATLTLNEAINVLETPLYVLVENSDNDWHFLLKTLDQASRDRLKHHKENRWLLPIHGGGSQITDRIIEHSQKPSDKFRVFCIYDSDRRHPDELDQNWLPVGGQGCQGYVTQQSADTHIPHSHHMLSRRFIESYIPRKQLEQCIGKNQNVSQEKIDAYFRLSKDGRWFFNMKKGFAADNNHENAGRAKIMYQGITPADKTFLNNGFGGNIADIYTQDGDFDWDDDARHEFAQITPRIMSYL